VAFKENGSCIKPTKLLVGITESQTDWTLYSMEFDINIYGMEDKRINRLSGI
jgi:hypothetical protein